MVGLSWVAVLFLACLIEVSALASEARLFALLEKVERHYQLVNDYTANFTKQERIGEELRPEETAFLKFQKPFKVYLRWISGDREGREALYVDGANRNKVLIHEPYGIVRFFTFLLDPGGWRVLQESRYAFTEIGIGRLIERVSKDARRAWSKGELRLVDRGMRVVNGREVLQIEGILPHNPQAGYSSHRMLLSIDRQYWLPVRASLYGWDNRLLGTYTYSDLRLNPGLGEPDFDPSNRAYGFPRWHISLADRE